MSSRIYLFSFLCIFILINDSQIQALESTEVSSGLTQFSLIFKTPLQVFITSFHDTVHKSDQLQKVFSTNASAEVWSKRFYDLSLETLIRIGVSHPVSLAAMMAHAILHTLVDMTEDGFLYAISYTTASWLLSQNHLSMDSAEILGSGLAFQIAKNIDYDFSIDDAATLARALNHGIYDFMESHNVFEFDKEPAYTILSTKISYRMSGVKDSELIAEEEITISNWDFFLKTIPFGTVTYGLKKFTNTFLNSVSNSKLLSRVFYVNESAEIVSNAWHEVIYRVSVQLNSDYAEDLAGYFLQVLQLTYDKLLTDDYTAAIANGLGLYLISQGVLNGENSVVLSEELSNAMEKEAKTIFKEDDLVSYVYVVIMGFTEFATGYRDSVFNSEKLASFVYYLSNELFYLSGIKEPFAF